MVLGPSVDWGARAAPGSNILVSGGGLPPELAHQVREVHLVNALIGGPSPPPEGARNELHAL